MLIDRDGLVAIYKGWTCKLIRYSLKAISDSKMEWDDDTDSYNGSVVNSMEIHTWFNTQHHKILDKYKFPFSHSDDCYSLSNVWSSRSNAIALGEKYTWFYRYLRHWNKRNNIVLSGPSSRMLAHVWFITLAPVSTKLATLRMLFILELACSALATVQVSSGINNMLKLALLRQVNCGQDHTRKVELFSNDVTWYTKHKGATLMKIKSNLL